MSLPGTVPWRSASRVVEIVFLWLPSYSHPSLTLPTKQITKNSLIIHINIHIWKWLLTVIDWIWMTETNKKTAELAKRNKTCPLWAWYRNLGKRQEICFWGHCISRRESSVTLLELVKKNKWSCQHRAQASGPSSQPLRGSLVLKTVRVIVVKSHSVVASTIVWSGFTKQALLKCIINDDLRLNWLCWNNLNYMLQHLFFPSGQNHWLKLF